MSPRAARRARSSSRTEIDELIEEVAGDTFDFGVYFGDVLHTRGGFDVVIGNPPYVRPHKLSRDLKARLKKTFRFYVKKADIYVCFVERSLELLRGGGQLAFIVSNSWMRLDSFELMRRRLVRDCDIRTVIEFSGHVFEYRGSEYLGHHIGKVEASGRRLGFEAS